MFFSFKFHMYSLILVVQEGQHVLSVSKEKKIGNVSHVQKFKFLNITNVYKIYKHMFMQSLKI